MYNFLKFTFDDKCGGRVRVPRLVSSSAFKHGAVFDKDLRKAERTQSVVVGDDVIARVIDAHSVFVP